MSSLDIIYGLINQITRMGISLTNSSLFTNFWRLKLSFNPPTSYLNRFILLYCLHTGKDIGTWEDIKPYFHKKCLFGWFIDYDLSALTNSIIEKLLKLRETQSTAPDDINVFPQFSNDLIEFSSWITAIMEFYKVTYNLKQ